MKTIQRPQSCCSNPSCGSNEGNQPPRLATHGWFRTRTTRRRRKICNRCGAISSATHGTPYHRMRRSKADLDRALHMSTEGMTASAIARVLRTSVSTITRWLEKAGRHAQAFSDEHDEVRFALTSEAGLNDGLAFPFVYAAIFLVAMGDVSDWALRWFAWELAGKALLGALIGTAVGWVLARLAFRAPSPNLRLAETEPRVEHIAGVAAVFGHGPRDECGCLREVHGRIRQRQRPFDAIRHRDINEKCFHP